MPFILDLVPHLKVGEANPQASVRTMMDRWAWEAKPYIITDSGFGSFSFASEVVEWGGHITTSVPSNSDKDLFPLLQSHLKPRTWRACFDENTNLLASCSFRVNNETNKPEMKFVVSSAFQVSTLSVGQSANSQIPTVDHSDRNPQLAENSATIPKYTKAYLENLTVEKLKPICSKWNIKQGLPTS